MGKKKGKYILLWTALLCVVVLWAALSFGGTMTLSLGEMCHALFSRDFSDAAGNIFLYSRLPRAVASFLAGAALATAGAVLQTVLGNKLASPGIIGVNAGAGLGITICCACGVFSGWMASVSAFLGSLVVVLAIALFSRRSGVSRTTVILTGVAMNSVLNAISESLAVLDTDVAILSTEFRVGGFSAVSYQRLVPAAVLIVAALAVLLTLCNELDVVGLGDETAQGIGLAAGKYRLVFLFACAVLAGAAVSFAGLLGFVGLIVPHVARRLVGTESRRLLPMCLLSGGAFVTACDLAARTLFAPFELPVGILMAVIGGPAFVVLLIRFKGGHRYA